jgi:CDP-glycerol glycerophosphotransferase (TagB/SpsB family)
MPRNNNHGYKMYKTYTIQEIFDLLKENKIPDELVYHVKDMTDSLKRATIIKNLIDRDGLKCQYCNKIPEFFALAKDNAGRWHLDLYSFKELNF